MKFVNLKRILRAGLASGDRILEPATLSETDFRLLAESSADVIFRIGPDQRPHYVSPSAAKVFGWTPEEMVGVGPDRFVVPEDLPALVSMAQGLSSGTSSDAISTFRLRRKDGRIIWIEANARPVRDPVTGKPGDMIVVMRDVTERKKLEEQLASLAHTDGLTGLGNRRLFDTALLRDWKATLAVGGQLSLLLLDVDHFKRFNDSYGHQVGDDCLRAIAAALRAMPLDEGATIARYGGEELAIILPAHDADSARDVAEAARRAVEALRLTHDGNPEGGALVTVSIGVATALARVGGSTRMPDALLQTADSALYKAKQGGRNRVKLSILIPQG